MPGLTSVDLVEERADEVVIKTNEGLMNRHNISTRVEDDRVSVEFDEEYQAGSKVTVNSHFVHENADPENRTAVDRELNPSVVYHDGRIQVSARPDACTKERAPGPT
jgi:hypothetical protein